jgi:ABC-type dipeptide/oligopeptide/nickel transport system ATPase component
MIMVTHDLGVVADIADRVSVMYAGASSSRARSTSSSTTRSTRTRGGCSGSIARVDRDAPERLPAIPGAPPSLLDPPQGCHFRPRCPHAFDKCTRSAARGARGARRAPRPLLAAAEEKRERARSRRQIG